MLQSVHKFSYSLENLGRVFCSVGPKKINSETKHNRRIHLLQLPYVVSTWVGNKTNKKQTWEYNNDLLIC